MDISPYQTFAKTNLGFAFDDPELLVTALTHRSYVNEHKKAPKTTTNASNFWATPCLNWW
jgi:dsRNA-specific ribonuclease